MNRRKVRGREGERERGREGEERERGEGRGGREEGRKGGSLIDVKYRYKWREALR